MFSKLLKEINTNPDDVIYQDLEKIKLKFGNEEITVGQAEPLFVYDVGLDLESVYVIALSKNNGAIVFNIPDDLLDKIMKRLPMGESFGAYLNDLIEKKAREKEFAYSLINPSNSCTMDADAAGEALVELKREIDKEKAKPKEIRFASNNWLKLHGYPMRRKGKGKKRKE